MSSSGEGDCCGSGDADGWGDTEALGMGDNVTVGDGVALSELPKQAIARTAETTMTGISVTFGIG